MFLRSLSALLLFALDYKHAGLHTGIQSRSKLFALLCQSGQFYLYTLSHTLHQCGTKTEPKAFLSYAFIKIITAFYAVPQCRMSMQNIN